MLPVYQVGGIQTRVSEELFNESQKIAQLTSTILASTNKVKGMEIQDTSWNSTIRHSLGKVKNRDDLFEFVWKLRKSKKVAFKQEGNLVQHYLYQCHYGGTLHLRIYPFESAQPHLISQFHELLRPRGCDPAASLCSTSLGRRTSQSNA
jgi:hypothetical protein